MIIRVAVMEDWRSDILDQLRRRNASESAPFADIVAAHNRLFEKTATLQLENKQLMGRHEAGGGDDAPATASEIEELKRKLYVLQEELTELHRRKGENAQQVIDLGKKVKHNETELSEKAVLIFKYEQDLQEMKRQAERLRNDMHELSETNQLLKDEYQTLQLALTTAERKLVDTQKENDRLLAQVMEFKERDVHRMNLENEDILKKQQETVRVQLEEAAKEPKFVVNRDRCVHSLLLLVLIAASSQLLNSPLLQ